MNLFRYRSNMAIGNFLCCRRFFLVPHFSTFPHQQQQIGFQLDGANSFVKLSHNFVQLFSQLFTITKTLPFEAKIDLEFVEKFLRDSEKRFEMFRDIIVDKLN